MRFRFVAVLLSLVLLACCGDELPTNPGPTQIDVTGRWSGDLTALGAAASMSWTLMQSGTAVTGPVTVALPSGIVLLNGFLTGTLSGTSLTHTISVGMGGIPNQPTCAGQLSGTMNVAVGAPSRMSGPLSVTSTTCTIQFSNTVTLTKQ
jgi:hypothetical protein